MDGAAANAKRKLESGSVYASATAAKAMKMPPRDPTTTTPLQQQKQQPKMRRCGSSTVAANDPCTMRRSFSDGTMYVLYIYGACRCRASLCAMMTVE